METRQNLHNKNAARKLGTGMSIEPLGAMSIGTLSALVGAFVVFLTILNLKTLRALRREAEHQAHNEFKAHVRALMGKLDQLSVPAGQGPRTRKMKRQGGKTVPATRTKPLSFPTRSIHRR